MKTLDEWREALGAAVGQLNSLIRSAHAEGFVVGLQTAKITNSATPDAPSCPLVGISVKNKIGCDDSFNGDTHG